MIIVNWASGVLYTLPKDTTFYFDEHDYLGEPGNERLEIAADFLNLWHLSHRHSHLATCGFATPLAFGLNGANGV